MLVYKIIMNGDVLVDIGANQVHHGSKKRSYYTRISHLTRTLPYWTSQKVVWSHIPGPNLWRLAQAKKTDERSPNSPEPGAPPLYQQYHPRALLKLWDTEQTAHSTQQRCPLAYCFYTCYINISISACLNRERHTPHTLVPYLQCRNLWHTTSTRHCTARVLWGSFGGVQLCCGHLPVFVFVNY